MREGPLAALFRKTEGEDGEEAGGTETEPASAPEAASAAAAATPHPRESGLPHPALKASTDSAVQDAREDSVPTPRERLRHAFSSEIPENVMERSDAPGDGRLLPSAPDECRRGLAGLGRSSP